MRRQNVRTTACAGGGSTDEAVASRWHSAWARRAMRIVAVELWANWRALHSRLRRYQAPNAAPSLNTQPGNPRPGLSSCTCAARATTPAGGATGRPTLPTQLCTRPAPPPLPSYLARTVDLEHPLCVPYRSRYRRRRPVQPAPSTSIPRVQCLPPALLILLPRLRPPAPPIDDHSSEYRASHCALSTSPAPITYIRAPSSLIKRRRLRCISHGADSYTRIYAYWRLSIAASNTPRTVLTQQPSYIHHGVLITSRRNAASTSPDVE